MKTIRTLLAPVASALLVLVGATAPRPATAQTYHEFYRLYNGTDHFYTADQAELRQAIVGGYTFEGVLGSVAKGQLKGTVPLYRLFNGRDHFYTTDIVERGRAESPSGGYHFEFIAGHVPMDSVSYATTAPVYRLYNGTDHFYTASLEERGFAQGVGYTAESTPFRVFVAVPWTRARRPLYRLFNGVDHFYTSNPVEFATAQAPGPRPYHYESELGYVAATSEFQTTALYRLYNGTDHFYTTSADERDRAIGLGYRTEGVAGYVRTTPATGWKQVFRLYNGTDHFYTTVPWEVGYAEGAGYRSEPGAFYVRTMP
jgi:uncharacterized protein DUF5648